MPVHKYLYKGYSSWTCEIFECWPVSVSRSSFCGLQGIPSTLWSDNAKIFKSSAKELQWIVCTPGVSYYLANRQVVWKFIVDRAPWWGGFWERMVQSVKRNLRKCIGGTLFKWIEHFDDRRRVNSRPLTNVHDDTEGISYPLCPSHLLYGRQIPITANGLHSEDSSTHETLTWRAKYHRLVINQFVKCWRNEYLLNLRESYSTLWRVRIRILSK